MTSKHSPPFNLSEAAAFVQLFKQILLGTSSHNKDDFFESLILQLTQAFGFEYGFISELKSENSLQVRVEYVKGKPSGYSLYQMEKTPCEKVIKEGSFVCSENLQQEFPEDIWLQENQIESYIGQAIYDQKGKVIGVLCLMSVHTLPDLDVMAEMIHIFAISAARELQKIQAERQFEEINQTLEKLVQARTIQLKKTNDNLRQEINRRKEIEFQLIKQEHQFRDLVYNIDNGILIVNREGKIKFANPAALEIFEQSLEKLLDYDFGIPILSHQLVELEIIKANNNAGLVEMNVTLTEWEQEAVYLVSFREITARKKAEDALINANKTKTEFLSTVSHEIRIPMQAILGFSELLKLQLKAEESQLYRYVETIHNSSQAILDLINDLLNINQVEAGKIVLNYRPLSIRDLIKEVTNIFSYEASKKNINLLVDIKKDVPEFISFDSLRLRQILINLIGNSFKFIQKGYIKIIIGVEDLKDQTTTLNIAVEDTGIGIKNEDQERIFEAFAQSKGQDDSHYLGNGLGLSIVQKYTELLGGTISLESQWGKGSTFTLILPHVEIINSMEPLENKTPQKTLNDLEVVTILVVDNVRENYDLIEGYFLGTEHTLLFAHEQQELMSILENYRIDIILINLDFQTINKSLALLNDLKEQDKIKNTPVIAMTDLPSDIPKSNQNLFQGFLEIPFNYYELVKVLSCAFLAKKKEKKNSLFTLTSSDYQAIKNVSNLLEKLQEIEDNSWYLIRSRMVFFELRKFSKNLQKLGENYCFQILINYGKTLANDLDSFDVEKISNTFEMFPQIRVSLLDAYNCLKKDRNSQP